MKECVIRAHRLGKQFRMRGAHTGRGMHETIERLARNPLQAFKASPHSADAGFWALRDASFEVERGEAIGLLGHNGAGKSVLLKLLSRVTAPTEGSAEVCGSVGPLLEVGAGFHPELSGRANVYFNGAILGMTRKQIRREFDAIVAFSEIGAFIDTPVKLYATGMRMRLAFSIAVHLEPDILLIDEALGVGDASFRAKCRKKIAKFIDDGCTLIIASHDPTLIAELCDRAILLEGGRIVQDGNTLDVLERYRNSGRKAG